MVIGEVCVVDGVMENCGVILEGDEVSTFTATLCGHMDAVVSFNFILLYGFF